MGQMRRVPAVAKTLALFFGSMRDAVANSFDEFGVEDLEDGDLLICNDPFRNGTHDHRLVVHAIRVA